MDLPNICLLICFPSRFPCFLQTNDTTNQSLPHIHIYIYVYIYISPGDVWVILSEANACLRAFRLRQFTPYTCDPQADEAAAAAAAAAKAALWSRFRARGPLGSTRKRT